MKNILIFCITVMMLAGMTYSQNKYGSDLAATVAFPTGPNSIYFKTGIGAIAGFYNDMGANWRIGLTIGFIRMGVNSQEVNNYFQTLGEEGSVEIDGSLSTIPILLSAKYLFPGESTRIYGIIEGGLYTYWTKAEGSIIYTGANAGTVPFDQSEFSSEVGFNFGLGALIPVSKEISIDASVRYHIVRNAETVKVVYSTGEEKVGSTHFVNVSLGANWNFDM